MFCLCACVHVCVCMYACMRALSVCACLGVLVHAHLCALDRALACGALAFYYLTIC